MTQSYWKHQEKKSVPVKGETKTYRKKEGGGRTQVGAANIYEPRCLKHWTPR